MNIKKDELEFYRVRELVAEFATSPEAKHALLLRPLSNNLSKVTALLNETEEMVNILSRRSHLPFISSDSITPLLNKIEKGLILNPSEFEKLADFIRVTRLIARFFDKNRDIACTLASYGDNLIILDRTEESIYDKIEHGQVSANADKDLARMRQQLIKINEQIKLVLNHYLQSKTIRKYLQDSMIVEKDGHYTLPIKNSFKNQLPSTIITSSSNGKTVYIEPRKIANLIQKKTTLEGQIEAIELQILGILSAKVFDDLTSIRQNMEIITELDIILARAKYSLSINGLRPEINQENILNLQQMSHPLLENPVPLSVELGNPERGLIITGPNAGGKTITLKTIGLSVQMTEMGLFLPSKSICNIPLSDHVFTSIGDHQDIDNSLSTFSAEMTEIAKIVENAQRYSMILFDEIGSGTDPNEGSAIAIAILQELQMRGCLVIATTHYSSIKDYSLKNSAFITAAMDFDANELTPTYHLLLNKSGDSNALWIANRCGMSQKVLKSAHKILDTGVLPTKKSKVSFKHKQRSEHKEPNFHKGDIVYLSALKREAIYYGPSDQVNQIVVFLDKKLQTVPAKRVKLRRLAKDLYPENYNLDLLFIDDWHEFKLQKDLDRGSKKAWKKLNKKSK
ncbi:endonuclease MutS2 [Lactobacillus agrestimuris]|uniref:endonuclease MutS2 n=1 Tax=Lactobacillus agrestimuris TaxID=2941328 RepID=UPI00204480E8|nr:DNA mismatch repair protein MutS [Lactobacillus agrestimuris]